MSKTGALTKELMNKAVHHVAEEIVAAKPGLDGCIPRGFAEKLVNEGKETFPKITMNKVNYASKLIKDELKKDPYLKMPLVAKLIYTQINLQPPFNIKTQYQIP